MKKLREIITLLAGCAICGNAAAIPFTIDSINVDLGSAASILEVNQLFNAPQTYDLEIGTPLTDPFFEIGFQSGLDPLWFFAANDLSVSLNWTAPAASGSFSFSGITAGIIFGANNGLGIVKWDSASADGDFDGDFTVAMDPITLFSASSPGVVGGSQTLTSYTGSYNTISGAGGGGAVSVAEPASLSLLAIGLLGFGWITKACGKRERSKLFA